MILLLGIQYGVKVNLIQRAITYEDEQEIEVRMRIILQSEHSSAKIDCLRCTLDSSMSF